MNNELDTRKMNCILQYLPLQHAKEKWNPRGSRKNKTYYWGKERGDGFVGVGKRLLERKKEHWVIQFFPACFESFGQRN